MSSPSKVGLWADGPFKLIATPQFVLDKSTTADAFVRTATHMAHVHNIFIRGLNTIYLQARHVKPVDYKDFVNYTSCFCTMVHLHHEGEENGFFLHIEEAVGEKGLMDRMVSQHHAFDDGLEAMATYINDLKKNPATFDGKKLVEIIDGFGQALIDHLAEEVQSLVELRSFGDRLINIEKLLDEEGARSMGSASVMREIPWSFCNHDITYENGLAATFPHMVPMPVRWALKTFPPMVHSSWWRFGCCDASGHPKNLYALGD